MYFDLPPSQGMALAVLVSHKNEAPGKRDIETELGFSESMASGILFSLEQKGYLMQDRKRHSVILTGKAFAAANAAHKAPR